MRSLRISGKRWIAVSGLALGLVLIAVLTAGANRVSAGATATPSPEALKSLKATKKALDKAEKAAHDKDSKATEDALDDAEQEKGGFIGILALAKLWGGCEADAGDGPLGER